MLKRLIEVALPLKEVSEQSAREKAIRYGHISTLHIWWARRPLAACRAAVFASLIPDPDDPECPKSFRKLVEEVLKRNEFMPTNGDGSAIADTPRNRCLEFIKYLVRWENSKKPEYLEPARKLIAAAHKFLHPDANTEMPSVLDPFAGGGAIPLESLRLGCKAHSIDINPVAHIIQLCTLVYAQKYGQPNSRDIPGYIKRLISCNRAKKKGTSKGRPLLDIDEMQAAPAPDVVDEMVPDVEITEAEYLTNPLAADVKYWASWIERRALAAIGQLYTPGSQGEIPISYLWSRTVPCTNPRCRGTVPLVQQLWLARRNGNDTAIRMTPDTSAQPPRMVFDVVYGSEITFDADKGTMSRTSAKCPFCDTTIAKTKLEEIGNESGFGSQLMAVVAQSVDGKVYLSPSSVFESAQCQWHPTPNDIPDETLPYLRSIFNCHVYGIRKWAELFNPRQLTSVCCFANATQAAAALVQTEHDDSYAAAVCAYLAVILDRLADFSTTLCAWKESAGHTFARQALGMIWDYCEVNPFSGFTGSWQSQVNQVLPVITACSFGARPAEVARGSATRPPIEPGSIEAVITDPPYYDAVPYADLSDFFYIWLKRVLARTHRSLFATPLTPKAPEIVQLSGRNKDYAAKTKEWFEGQMLQAFKASRESLCEGGILGVMYAHKTTSAWESLIGGLLAGGLSVTASWPLNTEMTSRLRAQGAAALASSIFLICRSREKGSEGLWDDVRKELKKVAKERLDFFWSQGIRGADFFISAIGPALSVFGKYERVMKLSGDEVTVGQFLDEVRSLVSNYALGKILKTTQTATIDAESRFYVVWKWSYGEVKVPADESFKLSQALGMPTELMWDRTGVLEKAGENVNTMPIAKRMKIKDLGEPNADGSPGSLIDVLHRMCVFREKNDADGMVQFLGRSGQGNNPTLWLVAQAISEILPDGDKEKQLMQGLLNQKELLEQAVGQGRLF